MFFAGLLTGLAIPAALAQRTRIPEEPTEDAAPSQVQATLASLFGRGATMPDLPNMRGTIAVPPSENPGVKTEEKGAGGSE